MLVLKLFLKLEQLTKEVRNRSLGVPARQALLLICETVRISLRDPITLSKVQTEHAFHSLLSLYVKYRAVVGLDIAISAGRCLYNVLNNNEERMLWFVYDLKSSMQVDAMLYLSMLIESQPSSMIETKRSDSGSRLADGKEDEKNDSAASVERTHHDEKAVTNNDSKQDEHKSEKLSDEVNHTQYIQLLHYAVRISHMMVCQSSSIQSSLKNHFVLMKALVSRLAYCLVNNYEFTTQSVNNVNIADFPYTEENAVLFIDISKLLYALDVYAQLDKCILYSENTIYLPHDFWLEYFTHEHARHSHMGIGSSLSMSSSSTEDISVHLLATENWSEDTDIRQAEGKDGESSSYRRSRDDKDSKDAKISDNIEASKEVEVSITELLNLTIAIVLSIGPYNCNLYIQVDKHASVYYAGKLADCEEYVLQLAMICTDSISREIFGLLPPNSSSTGLSSVNIAEIISHRKAYLPNSIVRIMSRLLQKAKNVDSSDRAALLTPVLIVANNMVKSHHHCFRATKNVLFPNPYLPVVVAPSSAASSSKKPAGSNNMDPNDCPPGTVRHDLIKLMTSFDPNIKRCVAEFIFSLCQDNGTLLFFFDTHIYSFTIINSYLYLVDEFIYRTGFGNAVALLKLKGLA